ncbi:MAG: CHAT domain-containing protein [Lewinellaceae bacterium]|nr:CHAT domain-containing protein [Lewinellaceae bacterium]
MIYPFYKSIFFLVLFLVSGQVAGQVSDSLEAEKYFSLYEEKTELQQYDSAIESMHKAIFLFRKADALGKWLSIQRIESSRIAEQLKQPFRALEMMDNTLREMKKWRKPRNERESQFLCFFYQTQGYIAKQYAEDFVRAKTALENAYDIFHGSLDGHYDYFAGFSFFQLGNTYVRFGEFESAKHMFEEGLAYSRKYKYPPSAKFADHGGMYVTMGNYAKAKQIFLQGMVYPGLPEEDFLFNKLSLAECLAKMNDLEGALRINRELESQLNKPLKEAPGKLPEFRRYLYENYGIIYAAKGDWNNALFWYQKALDTSKSYASSTKREEAQFENDIGATLLQCGRAGDALEAYHRALQYILPSFKKSSDHNPLPSDLTAENVIHKALHGKARAFLALGKPEKALRCYELIPEVEAKLRATHAYESSSLLALGESRKRFDEAIAVAWQLYESSNHERQYAERAFLLSEKARGMLLLESLVQAQADYRLPENIRRTENDLKVRMAWYEHEIAGEKQAGSKTDPARLAQLEKDLFQLKQEQEQLKTTLRENFPDYARLSEEVHFLNVAEVPALLRSGQAMLNYYLTEADAYIFYFDAAGMFGWRKAGLPTAFRTTISGFAQYMYDGDENDKKRQTAFQQTAFDLYEFLLEPELRTAARGIRSLLIVPDDALVFVPFEILLRQPGTGAWRELPWLLRDFSIGYAYSSTLLRRQQDISRQHRQTAAPRYPMGGFAPSYAKPGVQTGTTRSFSLTDGGPIYDIKSTQEELKKVHALTGGVAFYREQATEEQFKTIAAECRVLLLAMHGLADDEHPERSCLLFGIPSTDSLKNNVLYASELQIMQLHADLAVLSACNTGFGKFHKGEGVYSLARAFAAAGVPCTVMSLWRLHEKTAPKLVEAFFKHLRDGKTKDEALRMAKLEYLALDENYEMSHPFYWAGVMATGDLCALHPTNYLQMLGWLLGIAIVGILGAWFWRRRKKNS